MDVYKIVVVFCDSRSASSPAFLYEYGFACLHVGCLARTLFVVWMYTAARAYRSCTCVSLVLLCNRMPVVDVLFSFIRVCQVPFSKRLVLFVLVMIHTSFCPLASDVAQSTSSADAVSDTPHTHTHPTAAIQRSRLNCCCSRPLCLHRSNRYVQALTPVTT